MMKILLLLLSFNACFSNDDPHYIEDGKSSSSCKVTYLSRSGWLVETANHLLLFDYAPNGVNLDDFVRLEFNNAVKNKKQLFIFISHEHSDHFDSKLLDWTKEYANLSIVLGWDVNISQPRIFKLQGREDHKFGQVNVAVHPSTDVGSALLISVDGLTIYHAGDHAQWSQSLAENFLKETQLIKNKAREINVAFVPVESRRHTIMDGALLATRILAPTYLFPMHSKFEDYEIFAHKIGSEFTSVKVYYPKKNKDVFYIPGVKTN